MFLYSFLSIMGRRVFTPTYSCFRTFFGGAVSVHAYFEKSRHVFAGLKSGCCLRSVEMASDGAFSASSLWFLTSHRLSISFDHWFNIAVDTQWVTYREYAQVISPFVYTIRLHVLRSGCSRDMHQTCYIFANDVRKTFQQALWGTNASKFKACSSPRFAHVPTTRDSIDM